MNIPNELLNLAYYKTYDYFLNFYYPVSTTYIPYIGVANNLPKSQMISSDTYENRKSQKRCHYYQATIAKNRP